MASETLKKKLIFFSAFNYFFVIFLFLAIIYSQPTKKKQRLLPRPVTGLGRNESTAGEELREQRTDTWRKEQARKLRDPPTTLYIHPGTTTRWSNQGQSKVGSVRRLVVLVPFHTTNSTQCFHPPEKKKKKVSVKRSNIDPTLLLGGVGTDLFTFCLPQRARQIEFSHVH